MKTKLFTIVFFFFPFLGLACSCLGPSSFCETINLERNEGITIIEGKKVSETLFTMDIEVVKVHQGEENRSRITVLGDTGASCLVYTSQFEIGEKLLLALIKEGDSNYSLSICGLYYLRGKDFINQNTGEEEDISECLDVCVESPESPFYPNPSNGVFYSKLEQTDELLEDFIFVYDVAGIIVERFKISNQVYTENTLKLNLSGLPAGVYFLQHNLTESCGKINSSRVVIF